MRRNFQLLKGPERGVWWRGDLDLMVNQRTS
ncbi:hypothetical protein KC19_1G209200 [Ceratodon purpureus]|uniref:Uncharacterized protein n=1 Tax=Ceratodon purpureus TaxID=3225 RepID=A0A8T0JAC4_CERPU|nr:hypothetical protein KC19_1G209200 [Ceratodon purpureus]